MSGVNTAEVLRLARDLEAAARNFPQETKRILVSSRRAGATEFKRAAGRIYNLPAGRIGQDLSTTNPDLQRLAYEILGQDKGITVKSYQGRQVKQGLRFKVLRSSAPSLIRTGFIPRTGAAAGLPFRREPGAARMPIRVVYGPSVADMVRRAEVYDPAIQIITDRLIVDLTRRLERATQQQGNL